MFGAGLSREPAGFEEDGDLSIDGGGIPLKDARKAWGMVRWRCGSCWASWRSCCCI
jgi:hypothetical protein